MNRGEIDASFFCLAKLPPPSRTVSFFGFIFLWPASIISEPRNSCQLTRSALFLYSCHSSFCYTLAAVDIIWALCSWLGYQGSVILSITSTEFAWSGLFSVVHFIPTSNSSYHFSWYPGFPLHFRFFFLNILVVASRALRQPLLLQLQKFKLDFDLASDCYSHDWLNWHWYFLCWNKDLSSTTYLLPSFFIKMAPTNQVSYHKDEKVLCFHHEILYEAKILDVRQTDPDDKKSPFEYAVHYKGWKSTYVLLLPPMDSFIIRPFTTCLSLHDQCLSGALDILHDFDDHIWASSFGIVPFLSPNSWNRERKIAITPGNAHEPLLTRCASRWDDWVSTDRLRKFTDENRELATTLRREAESAFRQRNAKPTSKRRGGSDRSSARGSEERQLSVPGRGTKRGRDNEIEKVCFFLFSFLLA